MKTCNEKAQNFRTHPLDGMIQQSADANNFLYSNWSAPRRTPAGRDLLLAMYGAKFDLLVDRTYDGFSDFGPKQPSSPMPDRLNAAKKYVSTGYLIEGSAFSQRDSGTRIRACQALRPMNVCEACSGTRNRLGRYCLELKNL